MLIAINRNTLKCMVTLRQHQALSLLNSSLCVDTPLRRWNPHPVHMAGDSRCNQKWIKKHSLKSYVFFFLSSIHFKKFHQKFYQVQAYLCDFTDASCCASKGLPTWKSGKWQCRQWHEKMHKMKLCVIYPMSCSSMDQGLAITWEFFTNADS